MSVKSRKPPPHKPLKPITLRNLPAPVAQAVRERAARYDVSLNKSVIQLLEDAVGASREPPVAVHHDLDDLIGSWTAAQARAAERALAGQRRIDPGMWA